MKPRFNDWLYLLYKRMVTYLCYISGKNKYSTRYSNNLQMTKKYIQTSFIITYVIIMNFKPLTPKMLSFTVYIPKVEFVMIVISYIV